MKRISSYAAALLATSALISPALAQTADINGDFIGTVVIGGSARGVQTDGAAPETTINNDEIEARQATTLGQLIDTIPNVKLVNGITPQGAGIQIRGMGSQPSVYGMDSKVTVVVDGVTSGAEEVYRNGALFAMEPEIFDSVNVTRGPSNGFRFQGGAVGGTVQLNTKNGRDYLKDGDTFAFRQKLSGESLGNSFLTSSILSFAPNDEFDAVFFYGQRSADDRKDGNGAVIANTNFKQSAYMLKMNYTPDEASRFTFSHVYNEVPEYDVPYDVYLPSVNFGNVNRFTKDTTTYLEYGYDPLDNDLLDLTVRLSRKGEEMKLDDISGNVPFPTQLRDADHETVTTALRIENEAIFNTGTVSHNLMAGFEYSSKERSSIDGAGASNSSAPGGFDKSISVYLMDEMQIGEALTLTPQVRYERQTLESKNNGAARIFGRPNPAIPDGTQFKLSSLTGAMGMEYDITNAFSVFGTVAYNENLPLIDDIRGLFAGSFKNEAEKSRTYELGFSYDSESVFADGDTFQARLGFYDTHIWDIHTYSRIRTLDLSGAELEMSYKSGVYYADFNVGISKGTRNGTSDPFLYATGDSYQLTAGRTFMDEQFDAAFEIYHSPAFNRTDSTQLALSPTSANTLYNLRLGYTPNSGALQGVEFRAAIENITDETYRNYGNERNGTGRNIKLSIAKTF